MYTSNMKIRKFALLSSLIILGLSTSNPVSSDAKTDEEKLRDAVEVDGIVEHLKVFQRIANNNGGNRYVGTPGDKQSRDYIAKKLQEAGLNVQRTPVVFENFHEIDPAVLEVTSPISKVYQTGDPGAPGAQIAIMTNSGNGDVTANLQAVDILIPPGATPGSSTSGCQTSDFAGFSPGNIALIQRGGCNFNIKVDNAHAAGASGIIIFNEGNPLRTVLIGGIVPTPATIPIVMAEYAVGEELYSLPSATVHIKTNAEYVHTETENIIGETKTGRADHVIVLGTHIDSVEDGPGINDNGSGIATLLEIAKGLKKKNIDPFNQIRFAFWGAEEAGQVGSNQYVDSLSADDTANIALYLNADMLGSPNFTPSVYDVDNSHTGIILPGQPSVPGSQAIEQVLADFFKTAKPFNAPAKMLALDGRSDYRPFWFAGIPYSAITSGFDGEKTADEAVLFGGVAGAEYDACYHKACDTIQNVSKTSLKLMSRALAHTLIEFSSRDVIFP